MKPGDCLKCPKREDCTELCPEAEEYANQDYVKHSELYIRPEDADHLVSKCGISITDLQDAVEKVFWTHLTKCQREILTLLLEGKGREEICKELDITRHCLRQHLYDIRNKVIKS